MINIVKVIGVLTVLLASVFLVTDALGENMILMGKKKDKYSCRMYRDECQFNFLIFKKLPVAEMSISSSDTRIFTYKSIEYCLEDCSLDEFDYLNDSRLLDTHALFRVRIEPGLIGGADLVFKRNNVTDNVLAAYELVVNQPKRVVDRIFDVWIWIFGTLVSLLMGVLIDRESLLKIIKMPKAVILGFCCQYMFMPLVRCFHLRTLFSFISSE